MEKTIEKYIKGLASDQEREDVLKWAALSKENEEKLIRMETEWVFSTLPDAPPSSTAKEAIRRRIAPKRGRIALYALSGAAAVAVVLLSVFLFHNNSTLKDRVEALQAENIRLTSMPEWDQSAETMTQYHVNPGVTGTIVLPDGSVVILNSSTTLRTPTSFDKKGRVVELDGEGYFKIKSNKDWPMYVKTKKGFMVKVTGTEFNLSSYHNDEELKLTLVSGKVSLMADGNKKEIVVHEKEEVKIKNHSGIFKARRNTANMRLSTSWKDGYLVFDKTPLSEVIRKMERWYGVKINVKSQSVFENEITASFKSESLRQVLDLLDITCKIKYSLRENEVDLW